MHRNGAAATVADGCAFRQGGESMTLDLSAVMATDAALERITATVIERVAQGFGLSLRLANTGLDADAKHRLRELCAALAEGLADAGQRSCAVTLVVDATAPGPLATWEIRRSTLGEGPTVICCGRNLLEDSTAARRCWAALWNLWRSGRITPACWPRVDSACPLLAAERADNIEPVHGLQVPSGSAWMHCEVRLDTFLASGGLDRAALMARLAELVVVGDAEHERSCWPSATTRHDAWLNRRLAIEITGIGDYLGKLGMCPSVLSSLRHMQCLLDDIRRALVHASAKLAGELGAVPALARTNPVAHLPAGPCSDAWHDEWRSAIARSAVRNRCLLALSPWSLPATGSGAGCLDLLPLMAFADVCGSRAQRPAPCWDSIKFKHFHQRLLAVLGCSEQNALIAQPL